MTDSIADDLLRNGYDRWLRLEEEKAAIGDDLKELFAELKGQGFAPKALRESFRRVRNADSVDQQEHDAIVDLYVASLTGARPAPAYEKTLNNLGSGRGVDAASTPHHDPETGELADSQDQIGGNGPDLPVEASTDKQAAGAPRPTNSHSQVHAPQPANSAGEALPSQAQASPAALSDPLDPGPIPAFLDRRQPKAREWEEA